MRTAVALLIGVTGRTAAICQYLVGMGYTVHGVKQRSSSFNTGRIDHLYEDPQCAVPAALWRHNGLDQPDAQIRPTERYNLAAQSYVGVSFESPEHTSNAGAIGVLRLLEAIRISRHGK